MEYISLDLLSTKGEPTKLVMDVELIQWITSNLHMLQRISFPSRRAYERVCRIVGGRVCHECWYTGGYLYSFEAQIDE